MDKNNRKAVVNYTSGILFALLSGAAMYVERIVLVSFMGAKYTGLESLFENTFLILSALDIGVTTYLMNYLISAVNGGEDETRRAMKTISGYYRSVALVILLCGTAVSFLMPLLTKGDGGRESIYFFLIYLVGQLSQYFFGPRVLFLMCKEKSWLVSTFVQTGRIVQYLAGIYVIISTGNYGIYLAVSALVTVCAYLFLYIKAGLDYPVLRGRYRGEIEKSDRSVRGNLPGMILHRGSAVFFRSFEPLLVSALFGSVTAGVYSNYLLLSSAFLTPFWIFQSTVSPSVAAKCIRSSSDDNFSLYRRSSYINFLLSLLASFVYLLVVGQYIRLSFGKSFELGSTWDCIFTFSLFLSSLRTTPLVFRDTAGEYSSDWPKAVIEVVSALVLSFVLSHFLGLIGIPVAFIITYITVVIWREERTVLSSPLFSSGWDFVAKETCLMALGLIMIVALWYVREYLPLYLAALAGIVIYALFVALWFLSDKEALSSVRGREK